MSESGVRIRDRLSKKASAYPVWLTLVVALSAVGALSVVDYVTGSEIAFSLFYLAPILYVAWFGGRAWGAFIASVSALAWGVIDVTAGTQYSVPVFVVWNAGIRLGFFLLTVWLLSELHRVQRDLAAVADTDALTGIANTRSFYLEIEREIERSGRYHRPFALAYIDLDHFKSVNDTFGHAAGDSVLRVVADTITRSVRESDMVARLGGDEFAVLMPETTASTVAAALERVRSGLSDAMLSPGDLEPRVDATIGAVVFETAPASVDVAVMLADELMYEGKRSGRATIRTAVYRGAPGEPDTGSRHP